MDPMTFIAQQLDHRPPPAQPRAAPQGDSLAGDIRALLEERGPMRARDIAARLDLPSARIGALLKRDRETGRVLFRDKHYEVDPDWRPKDRAAMALAPNMELITWTDAAKELPDADLTVLVRTSGCEEPVWLGFFDGDVWRDIECQEITVLRWADMPMGGADHG